MTRRAPDALRRRSRSPHNESRFPISRPITALLVLALGSTLGGAFAPIPSGFAAQVRAGDEEAPDAPTTTTSELIQPSFADPEAEVAPAKDPGASIDTIAVEQCDGSRTRPSAKPKALSCARWKIEWSKDGKIWGVTSADTFAAVVADRERQLGFARQYARLFELPFDARWAAPSQVVCDACEQNVPSTPSGLWGDAQAFGANPTIAAVGEARGKLTALETAVVDVHLPRLRDIARLSRAVATARLAKLYGKTLDGAIIDLAKLQLDLENAAIFRSPEAVKRTTKAIDARIKALDASAAALVANVAKTVAKVHGGRYSEDGAPAGSKSLLVVDFAGEKVTATLVAGEAKSVWFEGNVFLDGRIAGKSLVAPEGAALTCTAHSTECGYVYAPAILRFDQRKEDKRRIVELWFQQSTWVHAKPFSR